MASQEKEFTQNLLRVPRENRHRQCGECTMCCTFRRVSAGGVLTETKPINVTCKFCTSEGCTVYAERPHLCRVYLCGWLLGLGPESDRPDRTKVLFDFAINGKGEDEYFSADVTACLTPEEHAAGLKVAIPEWVSDAIYGFRKAIPECAIVIAASVEEKAQIIIPHDGDYDYERLTEKVKKDRL